MHVGSESLVESVELAQHAAATSGIKGILSMTPVYFKPTTETLVTPSPRTHELPSRAAVTPRRHLSVASTRARVRALTARLSRRDRRRRAVASVLVLPLPRRHWRDAGAGAQ
eukprot:5061663-Prymnesium_polylepis.1